MAGIPVSGLPTVTSATLSDIVVVDQNSVTSTETLQQVATLLNSSSVLTNFLSTSGGTITGSLLLNQSPTTALQAVNKQYVDSFAAGIKVIAAVQAATTANLTSTQAGSGIGATLTNSGTQLAFVADGYSANAGDRILVKNQTAAQNDGVYSVTTVGSGSTNWVLTRTTDYDTTAQIIPGTLIPVNHGTVNTNTSWLQSATIATVDTTPLVLTQFSFSSASFLQIANNLSDVASVSTARTNLGLGTAATKAISNNSYTTVSAVSGTPIVGELAIFSDTVGSIEPLTTANNGVLVTNSSGVVSVSTAGQIPGTTTNNSASSGNIGEYINSIIPFSSSISLGASGTAQNVTNISLTAGNWIVTGSFYFVYKGAVCTAYNGWISTASATEPDLSQVGGLLFASSQILNLGVNPPQLRLTLSSTTTVYLTAIATFSSGNPSVCGQLEAIRVR